MADFYGKLVGKYTIYMDPSWEISIIFWWCPMHQLPFNFPMGHDLPKGLGDKGCSPDRRT